MNIREQNGHWIYAVEITQARNIIKGKSPTDRRRKIILGVYKDCARACEVFDEIRRAKSIGVTDFKMPEE